MAPLTYVDVGDEIPDYKKGAGQRQHLMQQPLVAGELIKHLVTPAGFEPVLFADESDLGGKPIAMTWDERGRLWVAVTVDYPRLCCRWPIVQEIRWPAKRSSSRTARSATCTAGWAKRSGPI